MKNILITGAGGNLGKVTVEHFSGAGHQVFTVRSPRIPVRPEETNAYAVDLTDSIAAVEVVHEIVGKYGRLDAALLLAGGYEGGGPEAGPGALERMIRLNAMTAWNIAAPAWQQMKRQGYGRLVFIGARLSIDPVAGKDHFAYAASKSLLFRFSEMLNADAGGSNLASAVLVPGTIDTASNRSWNPGADRSTWVTPEKMAELMAELLEKPAEHARGRFDLF